MLIPLLICVCKVVRALVMEIGFPPCIVNYRLQNGKLTKNNGYEPFAASVHQESNFDVPWEQWEVHHKSEDKHYNIHNKEESSVNVL